MLALSSKSSFDKSGFGKSDLLDLFNAGDLSSDLNEIWMKM
jgi:hypothetical protein